MRKFIVGLAVLAVILGGGWFADNLIRSTTESRLASQLADGLGAPAGAATVKLGGTPFALWYLTHSVPNAAIAVSSFPVEVNTTTVTLTTLQCTTGGLVRTDSDVIAQSVSGTVQVSYDELSRVSGLQVSDGGDGWLKAHFSTTFLGQNIRGDIMARPQVDPETHKLRLAGAQVWVAEWKLDSDKLQQVSDVVAGLLDLTLPYGLDLVGFQPDADGVTLGFTAQTMTVPIDQ